MANINIGRYQRIKKVYNVGIIGEGKYSSRNNGKHTEAYRTWISMLQRCYDLKLHSRNPSYKDCTVIESWHNFQNFASWFYENYIQGYQLDKDLLKEGNKIYSSETCRFVPKEINLLLIKPINRKSKYHTGVSNFRDKFIVHIRKNNKQYHIGSYNSLDDAIFAYNIEKEKHVHSIVEKYKSTLKKDLYDKLINYKILSGN